MAENILIQELQKSIPPELMSKYGKFVLNAIEDAKMWVAYNMPDTLTEQDIRSGMKAIKHFISDNMALFDNVKDVSKGIDLLENAIAKNLGGKLRRQDVLSTLDNVSDWMKGQMGETNVPKAYLQTEPPKVYSWQFTKPMEKTVAVGVLQDNKFYDFDSGVYDYTKINLKQLDNSDIRQAIITVNPGMDTDALTTVARRNSQILLPSSYWPAEQQAPAEESVTEEVPTESEVEAPVEAEGETEGETKTETIVEGETEEETPIKEITKLAETPQPSNIIMKRDKKPLTKEEKEGAVAWKQGIMYKLVYPPYGQGDVINSRQIFPNMTIYEDAKSAYRALIENHKGTLPPTIVRDMGMMTIQITNGNLPNPKLNIIEKGKAQRMGGEALSAI